MPRNNLIEERIELRRRQPLDWLPLRPHFQHVGWALYEWPFAQCRANDPGRHVEAVILRVHLAGVIFKAPRISLANGALTTAAPFGEQLSSGSAVRFAVKRTRLLFVVIFDFF